MAATPETGSLILLHFHSNLEILERISETNEELFYLTDKFTFHLHENKAILDLLSIQNNQLYYDSKPVMTPISNRENNWLQEVIDGLFVDGTYFLTQHQYEVLTEFDYLNNILTYKGIEVGLEYTYVQISQAISDTWTRLESATNLSWFFDAQEDEVNDATEP